MARHTTSFWKSPHTYIRANNATPISPRSGFTGDGKMPLRVLCVVLVLVFDTASLLIGNPTVPIFAAPAVFKIGIYYTDRYQRRFLGSGF